jgi:hypothetical protein
MRDLTRSESCGIVRARRCDVPDFSELLGKKITSVRVEVGSESEVYFTLSNGDVYRLYHEQDCCESVRLEDVCGSWEDITGEPLLIAEVVTNSKENPDGVVKDFQDSFTWTFYKLATISGYVTMRWYGESNGYYSEEVDFEKVE